MDRVVLALQLQAACLIHLTYIACKCEMAPLVIA